jgi:putative ABC transport system substrate-binding protein
MSEAGDNPAYVPMFKELRRLGYAEGRNLIVDRYSAEGRGDRFTEMPREVVRTNPDLIFAAGNPLALSFKVLTDTIPVVASMGEPVANGIVASLARPGGNITGVSVDTGLEIWGKRLQILREAIPKASRVGHLTLALAWDSAQGVATQEAAQQAGISLLGPGLEIPIQETEYRRVLTAMAREHADAVIVSDATPNFTYRHLVVDLIERARLPTIYPDRVFFENGGLMSYGPFIAHTFRRLAGYIDQILRGAKPGDLPIYLDSKFELLLNLKSAKAHGIEMPTSLLARADQVIK